MLRAMMVVVLASSAALAKGPPRRTKTLLGHKNYVTSLDLSAEGRLLASASGDGTVRIWSVEAGRARKTIRLAEDGVPRHVRFSPNRKSLAVALGATVLLLSPATGDEQRRFDVGQEVTGLAFSPDSTLLAVAAGALRIHAVDSGAEVRRLDERVTAVAFTPDGAAVLAAGSDGVRAWPRSADAPQALHPSPARGVSFSDDGRTLLVAGQDGRLRALGLDGKERWTHDDLAAEAAVGAYGPWVLAGIGERRLWALGGETGQDVWYLEGETDDLQVFSLAPAAKLLATAGKDSTIDLWAW